jgi:hypothetical protein
MRRSLCNLLPPTGSTLRLAPIAAARAPLLPAQASTAAAAFDPARRESLSDSTRAVRGGAGLLAWAAECSGRGGVAAPRGRRNYHEQAYKVGPNTATGPLPHPVSRAMQVDTLALVRAPNPEMWIRDCQLLHS